MNSLSTPLKKFTEQLGYLVNLSRIIDRNRDDDRFASNGSEIVYVFDTNVVQMFLEPYKNPQFSEIFHTPLWDSEREADLDANAQACLITGEYLFSGKLPGQKGGVWYMTRGHKAEMDHQQEHLRSHIIDNISRMRREPDFNNQVLEKIARLTHALDIDPVAGRSTFSAKSATADRYAPWLDELRKLSDKDFRHRAPGIRAREICRILSRDDVAEPANQLFRYRSGEIAGRFRTLESLLNSSSTDRPAIETETADWRVILADILSRRPANIKTRDGLKADCQALGLLSWAARQPENRNRRFVLVTGDAVLLEAYRWQHVRDPQLHPYIIRPINHFAPLFNPVSAQSTLSSQQNAFLKLQQVLEFVLVSINLQLLVNTEADTRQRARDAFVLEVQRHIELAMERVLAAFPDASDPIWLRRKTRELERLVQELRPIERLMLEAFPNLVAPRLAQERIRIEEPTVDGGDTLLAAIEKRLSAANEIGAQFSLQTTPDTIVRLFDAFRTSNADRKRRATVYDRLSFGAGRYHVGAEATVAWLQKLSRAALYAELETLKGHPAKLFALAALLAFRLEIWSEAARYSLLASTASLEQTKYVDKLEEAPAEHYEYVYLMAAALRFRLASFKPSDGHTYSDPWGESLRTADDALTRCSDYHAATGQLSRTMRAQSERAALHISYCEWFAFGLLAGPSFYPDPEVRALTSLGIAVTELRKCEDMLVEAQAHAVRVDVGVPGAPSQTVLRAVSSHFRSNVLAAIMTVRRFKEIWPGSEVTVDALAAILPAPRLDDAWSDGPLISRAYIAAVQGDSSVLDALDNKFTLPLDCAVLAGLRRMTAQRT
jgi:hypothetical protein